MIVVMRYWANVFAAHNFCIQKQSTRDHSLLPIVVSAIERISCGPGNGNRPFNA